MINICQNFESVQYLKYFVSVLKTPRTHGIDPARINLTYNSFLSEFTLAEDVVFLKYCVISIPVKQWDQIVCHRLYKKLVQKIRVSLCVLINRSLADGKTPMEWLKANIVPKRKDKHSVENYNLVSLLSVASEVAVKCILQ